MELESIVNYINNDAIELETLTTEILNQLSEFAFYIM